MRSSSQASATYQVRGQHRLCETVSQNNTKIKSNLCNRFDKKASPSSNLIILSLSHCGRHKSQAAFPSLSFGRGRSVLAPLCPKKHK